MDPSLMLTRSTPTLLTLPQEIQDHIFFDAYGHDGDFCVVSKKAWDRAEAIARNNSEDDDYVMRPFPSRAIEAMLVSKAFFINAARALMGTTTICPPLMSCIGFVGSGIPAAFVVTMKVDFLNVPLLDEIQNLRHLVVKLDEGDFRRDAKQPWRHDLDVGEFSECLKGYRGLSGFVESRTLCSFGLQAKVPYSAKTEEHRKTWNANVRRIESYFRKKALQKKTRSPPAKSFPEDSPRVPLYHGSLVSLNSSKLLKPGNIWDADDFANGAPLQHLFGARGSESLDSVRTLTDDDIPDSPVALRALAFTSSDALLEWVRAKKRSNNGGDQ